MFSCPLEIFFNQNLKKNPGILSVSNSLDPDQAQHHVWPDLDPNRLQTTLAGKYQ